MTTNSGDATTTGGAGAVDESGSVPVDTPSSSESPYDIGLVTDGDADETGPEPLDTDLEDKQVRGEA